jgi:hypothetical protein
VVPSQLVVTDAEHVTRGVGPSYAHWFLLERYQDPEYQALLDDWDRSGQPYRPGTGLRKHPNRVSGDDRLHADLRPQRPGDVVRARLPLDTQVTNILVVPDDQPGEPFVCVACCGDHFRPRSRSRTARQTAETGDEPAGCVVDAVE